MVVVVKVLFEGRARGRGVVLAITVYFTSVGIPKIELVSQYRMG